MVQVLLFDASRDERKKERRKGEEETLSRVRWPQQICRAEERYADGGSSVVGGWGKKK